MAGFPSFDIPEPAGPWRTLVARCGPLMAVADMDGTTADATNPDLADPVAWSLRQLGGRYTVATVPPGRLDQLLDGAELRLKRTILSRLQGWVDIMIGENRFSLSQMARALAADIDLLQARYDERFVAGTEAPVLLHMPSRWPAAPHPHL
jgi:hypothetical protein